MRSPSALRRPLEERRLSNEENITLITLGDRFSFFHGSHFFIEAEITSPISASEDNSSEIAGVLPNLILSCLSKLKKIHPKSYQCNQDSFRAVSPSLVLISP